MICYLLLWFGTFLGLSWFPFFSLASGVKVPMLVFAVTRVAFLLRSFVSLAFLFGFEALSLASFGCWPLFFVRFELCFPLCILRRFGFFFG